MLSIIYITCRPECRLDWTIQSIKNQTLAQLPLSQIQFVVVDKVLVDLTEKSAQDTRREEIKSIVSPVFEDFIHVGPKPSPVQGPYKLTPVQYFGAGNARNTGICYAKHNYVAFVDDTSVLLDGWMHSVYEGLTRPDKKHVICGAYKKVNNLKVENGRMIEGEILPKNVDSRLSHATHTDGPIAWCGSALYGCSFCMPTDGFIEVNGMNELCDGLGGEDYDFGIRIEKAGYKVYYDKRMMTLEENQEETVPQPMLFEVHRQDPVISYEDYVRLLRHFHLTQDRINFATSHRLDQSHFMVDLVYGRPYETRANPEFDLRVLRHDTLLRRCQLHEYVWWKPDRRQFFTGKLLSEYDLPNSKNKPEVNTVGGVQEKPDSGVEGDKPYKAHSVKTHQNPSTEILYKDLEKIIPPLEGWCTVEKAKKMADWIINHKPLTCVEVGVFAGRSLVAIGMALKQNNNGGHVFGIDPWTAPAALEGKNDTKNDEWWAKIDFEHFYFYTEKKIREFDLRGQISILRTKSVIAAEKYFADQNSLDLVHIDGNHSEETSTLDVKLWAPKIKSGGAIFFDDTDWPTTRKAQDLVLSYGFVLSHDCVQWKIFSKI